MHAGIEALNIYYGTAVLDLHTLAKARNLDGDRFGKLLMKEKTVPMPYEDPVAYGVNAAKPILDRLTEEEKSRIDMLITCTESGIDFGKSLSTYIHHYLGLSRNCRLFELKNACYSGTAGFQMAVNYVLSQTSPGRKALVVCSDIIRMSAVEGSIDLSFAEPSAGSGAVAMLVSDRPLLFQVDKGAIGVYGYEVMDTCRSAPDSEAGNADLSLLSYLDCCENTFREYQKRVEDADYETTFDYLAFHTPFGGMVKGAHRTNMRKFKGSKLEHIEADFQRRVTPSLTYCQRVGNMMGATTHLALASVIDNAHFDRPGRIGVFSYGSGCCSEFYSGIVSPASQDRLREFGLSKHLDERYNLSMREYEDTFEPNIRLRFGTRDYKVDISCFDHILHHSNGRKRLVFSAIKDFHRLYEWM